MFHTLPGEKDDVDGTDKTELRAEKREIRKTERGAVSPEPPAHRLEIFVISSDAPRTYCTPSKVLGNTSLGQILLFSLLNTTPPPPLPTFQSLPVPAPSVRLRPHPQDEFEEYDGHVWRHVTNAQH